MKFVLDENLQTNQDELPKDVINASDLYFMNGLREHGIEDNTLLSLATEKEYIIVTQDMQLVTIANRKNIDIVYGFGRAGRQWHFISKELNISDKGKLRRYVQFEITSYKHEKVVVKDISNAPHFLKGWVKPKKNSKQKKLKAITKILEGDDNTFIPYFMIGNSNKVDLTEPKFYEGMRGNKKPI